MSLTRRHFLNLTGLCALGLPACSRPPRGPHDPIRFGHFPNLTHLQGLVAHALSRTGKGWYEERLGVPIEWYPFTSGADTSLALANGSLDVTYMGPSPLLNLYEKSKGTDGRILAGAANGGSALLVRKDAQIHTPQDFRGKRIAIPAIGNTQHVQLHAYLTAQGLTLDGLSDEATILKTKNADLVQLFIQKSLDGAWTTEPYVTMLVMKTEARIFLADEDTCVTLLAASENFLSTRSTLAQKLQAAHLELTDWILAHPTETRALISAELTQLTNTVPPPTLLDQALPRVHATNDLPHSALTHMITLAQKAGFLEEVPSLDRLVWTP